MIVSLVNLEKEYCDFIEKHAGEKVTVINNLKESMDVLAEADIVISWWNVGREVIMSCKSLKWLYIMNAGVDKLPFEELAEKGVIVTNVSGIHATQMAEQTLGMMIAFSRQLNRCTRNQLNRKWENIPSLGELTGKTLCIIGAGSVGQEIARKAKVFDMRVIGLKKNVQALEDFDEVYDMSRLHEALGESEYVVVIVPLTDETYHLIKDEEFKAMKPGSFFVNMSRGDTVDETALIEALEKGYIAGAGLDVFHVEPLPADSPLWDMENVIITPHNAGLSPHNMKRSIDMFVESLKCYRQGKPMPNRIDLQKKY